MSELPPSARQLAREIAEGSIVTMALARLLEQLIAEIHETQVKPLRARIAELEARIAKDPS